MSFGKRLLKRLGYGALALLGLSVLSFIIARVLPGDPVRMALGPYAPEWVADRIRKQMHLDEPIYIQYFYWLRDALVGNLGESLFTRRSVAYDIIKFLPATLELILFSLGAHVILGVMFGVIAGRYTNTWIDNAVRVFSYIGAAVPDFVFAIVAIFIFGYAFHLFPCIGRLSSGVPSPPTITGMFTIDALITGNFATFVDALWHLILPSFSTILIPTSIEARITRSSVVENLNQDYILSAISHGLPERLIMLKYLLKPSLIPTVSVMGLNIACMLSSLFIIESIFSWPGFARYGMNAMFTKDLNAIVGVIMVTGVMYTVMNIIVDLVVERLDPRIRVTALSR